MHTLFLHTHIFQAGKRTRQVHINTHKRAATSVSGLQSDPDGPQGCCVNTSRDHMLNTPIISTTDFRNLKQRKKFETRSETWWFVVTMTVFTPTFLYELLLAFPNYNLENPPIETYENRILDVKYFVEVLRPQNACTDCLSHNEPPWSFTFQIC